MARMARGRAGGKCGIRRNRRAPSQLVMPVKAADTGSFVDLERLPIQGNLTCGHGRESRRGDRRRVGRIGERRGVGGARIPRDSTGIATAARRARRLVRGRRHGATGRCVPARQHGVLHESRSLPRHRRRRPFPRSATEAQLHHAGWTAKPVQGRQVARALPPGPRATGRALPHIIREAPSRMGNAAPYAPTGRRPAASRLAPRHRQTRTIDRFWAWCS